MLADRWLLTWILSNNEIVIWYHQIVFQILLLNNGFLIGILLFTMSSYTFFEEITLKFHSTEISFSFSGFSTAVDLKVSCQFKWEELILIELHLIRHLQRVHNPNYHQNGKSFSFPNRIDLSTLAHPFRWKQAQLRGKTNKTFS